MKKFGKLLILLLAVSLMLGATVIFASAAGDSLTDSQIKSLTELYSKDIYYAEDFEADFSITPDSVMGDKSGIIAGIDESNGNNYLKIVGGASGNEDVSITAKPDGEIDGFVFNTRIAAGGGMFNIYASGTNDVGDRLDNAPLVTIDFTEGSVFVQGIGAYGIPVMTKLDGISLVRNAWYSVSLIYSAANAGFTLAIEQTTDADGVALDTPVTIGGSYGAALVTVDGAKVAVAGATIDDTTVLLDDVYLYEGVTVYDFAAEDAKIPVAIEKLVSSLDSAAPANRGTIVDRLSVFVIKRAFSSSDAEITKLVKFATLKIAEHYADEYINLVDTYNGGNLYSEKVAQVEKIKAAQALIPEIPVYTEDEDAVAYALMQDIKSEIVRVTNELVAIVVKLDNSTSQSEAFIDYMSDKNITVNRYSDIYEWVTTASEFEFDPTYYNVITVGGEQVVRDITDAYNNYMHLVEKVSSMAEDAGRYIGYVNVMIDSEKPFIDRYNAYVGATSIRFLDVEHTYVDEDGNKLSDAVALFKISSAGIVAVERACEGLLIAVADAKTATDIENLNKSIAKIETYDVNGDDPEKIAVELTFPGVVEAIAEYERLCVKRVQDQERAEVFIAAVELVKSAKNTDDLKAAIAGANSVLYRDIIGGFEGYSEALSYFSNIESNLLYNESNATQFISIVNSLNDYEFGKEKYDAIKLANEYLAKLVEDIEGVGAAKAVLAAAIAEYEAALEAENAAFDAVIKESVKLASAGAPTDAYLKVVAIIKKLFE